MAGYFGVYFGAGGGSSGGGGNVDLSEVATSDQAENILLSLSRLSRSLAKGISTNMISQFQPFRLSFPVPGDDAFAYDLRDKDMKVLLIAGISALVRTMTCAGAPSSTDTTSINVTSALTVLTTVSACGRIVRITNHGEFPVMIGVEVDPVWGELGVTEKGEILLPGGTWETPRQISGAVNGICKTGEQALCTVVEFQTSY